MRTFIAIDLPREIKDFLSRLQERLKTSQADVKWVQPQNIHLTLKFLGEIDDKKLNRIIQILEDICRQNLPFYIRISSMGAFPKTYAPRVIWVGIDKGDMQSKQIATALEDKIKNVGLPAEDRPFTSHITIGRTKSSYNRERLVQDLNNLAFNFGRETPEFLVTRLTLFKSTLTPKGPIYEIIHNANLKTS